MSPPTASISTFAGASPSPSALVERLQIKNVRALDPAVDLDRVVDVIVEGGRLLALEPGALASGPLGLDGSGLLLFPGLIELRAHLGQPGYEYREDLESGLRAAAAGGFTQVGSQPDTSPINDSRAVTEALLSISSKLGLGTLHPLAAATVGLEGRELAEIGDQLDAGARAASCGRRYVSDASIMRRLLEYCRTFGTVVLQQPLEPSLVNGAVMHEGVTSTRLGLRGSPRVAEQIALERDLALCHSTGARYHACSLSTLEAVRAMERAKADQLPVSCDVTPAHLLLEDADVGAYDTRFRLDPPLREARDRDALLRALRDGVIDCISSDHRPRSSLETDCEFDQSAPGSSGLELCLPLVWKLVLEGELSASRAIAALTTGPAAALGLPAPRLEAGQLANFVLFDPNLAWTPQPSDLRSKGKNSPFLGRPLRGRVLLATHQGRLIHELARSKDPA